MVIVATKQTTHCHTAVAAVVLVVASSFCLP